MSLNFVTKVFVAIAIRLEIPFYDEAGVLNLM